MIISLNQRRNGYAVVMMICLIALLAAVVAANSSSVRSLERELKLLEKRQAARWTSPATNTSTLHQP